MSALNYEIVRAMHYVLTEDDVFDGRNVFGLDVSDVPLNVPLCGGCDRPVPPDGRCEMCEMIHADLSRNEV